MSEELNEPFLSVNGSPIIHRECGRGYVPPPREQTWLNASFILVAELVGTGVLGLPHCMAVLGLGRGVTVLVIFSLLVLYSGHLLHRLQAWFPGGITYGDVSFEVVGKTGRDIVFLFIYVAFFGNLAISILTCAEALENVFYDRPEWCKWWYTVVTVVFLSPFCQLRTLHKVSYVASASAISIFFVLLLVLFDTFFHDHDTYVAERLELLETLQDSEPIKRNFVTTISALTTSIFAFGGQGLYFETMAEMKHPEEFPYALKLTTVLILIVYLSVAVSCNVVYGDDVPGNILYILKEGTLKRVCSFLLFFHVCISYVLAQQVIGRAIHVRVYPNLVDTNTRSERWAWFKITVFLATVSFLIANGIPIFKNLMGIIGALSTAPLTFGVPALLVLKVANDRSKAGWDYTTAVENIELPLLYFFILMTLFLMGGGLYANIVEISKSASHSPFAC